MARECYLQRWLLQLFSHLPKILLRSLPDKHWYLPQDETADRSHFGAPLPVPREDSGEEDMKTSKHRSVAPAVFRTASEKRNQREIENYLKALSSYPDRVARDPQLSLEQHLCSFIYAQPVRIGAERRRS